jgi:hypothetical protein
MNAQPLSSPTTQAPHLRPDLLAIADLIEPGTRVLDIGCGDGALLEYLRDRKQVKGTRHRVDRGRRAGLRAPWVERAPGQRAGRAGRLSRPELRHCHFEPDAALSRRPEDGARRDAARGAHGYRQLLELGTLALPAGTAPHRAHPVAVDLPQQWYESPRRQPFSVTDFARFCRKIGIRIDRQIYMNRGTRVRTGRFKNLLSTTAVFTLHRV